MSQRERRPENNMRHGQDRFLYERLKFRLAKAALIRSIAGILFTDIEEENAFIDRLYQLYVLALVLAWASAMLIFLIDFVEQFFFTMGFDLTLVVIQAALMIPLAIFIVLAFQYARSSPWKMASPDIAFVASFPLSRTRIIVWEMIAQLVPFCVFGFLGGFLLALGFQSGTGILVSPPFLGFLGLLLVASAGFWAWMVGVVRLTIAESMNRRYLLLVIIILVLIVVSAALVVLGGIDVLGIAMTPIMLSVVSVVACLGFALVVALSRSVDVTKAIEDNSLYADLYSIRHMPLYDAAGYAEIKRRKKVAQRGQILHLRIREGRGALLSKALMSHIRQFEGIPHIFIWSALAAPMLTFLVLKPQSLLLWMILLQVLLLMSQGVREITRVFRDDMRNRALSDHLPFTTLSLFIYDSLVASVFCLILSLPISMLILGSGEFLLIAICISVLANTVFILCAGLDSIPLFTSGKSVSYEILVLVFVAGVFLISLFELPLLIFLFMLVYSAFLVGMLKHS